jgi:hypothetical protein
MQCDICFRTGGQKLPFLCPTDARNRLYETRVQHAHALLEHDVDDQKVTSLLSQEENQNEQGTDSTVARLRVTSLVSERDQAVDRTQQIIAHADELRVKVEKARQELVKKKAIINRRKSELASITNGIEARRIRQMDEVEKALRMTKYKWNQTHSITASSRGYLCGEAAKLYGLRRVRRSSTAEEYKIGGVSIIDLRAMNSEFFLSSPKANTDPFHSCESCTSLNSLITYCAPLDFIDTLSGYSSARGNYPPTSRLSSPNYIPTSLVIQAHQCSLPGIYARALIQQQSHSITACRAANPTTPSAALHRPTAPSALKGRPSRLRALPGRRHPPRLRHHLAVPQPRDPHRRHRQLRRHLQRRPELLQPLDRLPSTPSPE